MSVKEADRSQSDTCKSVINHNTGQAHVHVMQFDKDNSLDRSKKVTSLSSFGPFAAIVVALRDHPARSGAFFSKTSSRCELEAHPSSSTWERGATPARAES